MADIALGSVEKIVKIALKIKEAVETVKQNEKECRDIQRCITRVGAILKKLDEMSEMMKDDATRGVLEDLEESLERALELITECQRKHIFRRFLGARDMAKELGRVQDDIVRKVQLGNFATNCQSTIMLINIQASGTPPRPPPPLERVVIDGFIQFGFSELEAATKCFSDKNIIGKSLFSTVYKGILHDGGQMVAIKKLEVRILIEQGRSLYDEINIVLNLNHKNVIRLLGYCHEIKMVLANRDQRYVGDQDCRFCLVEEYMPNGNMGDTINNGTQLINWSSRFKMIQGIAQGLHYLHEQGVLHLDLKPSNILLDYSHMTRINDFGVAKMLEHGDDEICVDFLVGTLGYIAPEHLAHGILSTKSDVYAFGVTLLRTISTMSIAEHPGARGSAAWAWKAREAVRMEELFDSSLCDKFQLAQIKRFMEIGLLCVETDRKDRPTMAEVLAMLNGEKELPALKKPFGRMVDTEKRNLTDYLCLW